VDAQPKNPGMDVPPKKKKKTESTPTKRGRETRETRGGLTRREGGFQQKLSEPKGEAGSEGSPVKYSEGGGLNPKGVGGKYVERS